MEDFFRLAWRFWRWPLLVIGLWYFSWWSWIGSLRSDFSTRIEALRESGAPVSPRDLAWPAVAPEQNAAPLLAEFLLRLQKLERALPHPIGSLESKPVNG